MASPSAIRQRALRAAEQRRNACTVLVVIDSVLSFDAPAAGDRMSLSRFISVLQEKCTVVTRRYAPGELPFRFADAAEGLPSGRYAAVFLFGFESEGNPASGHFHLTPEEINAFRDFMDGGAGGVFATGDHSSVGQFLSSRIPRVRHLRLWSEPRPAAAAGASAGADIGQTLPSMLGLSHKSSLWSENGQLIHYALETDGQPQRIFPNFLPPEVTGSTRGPHPLLQTPGDGVINVMPDHAHEGTCRLPSPQDLAEAEWPEQAGQYIEVVAKAMSSGNAYRTARNVNVSALVPGEFASIVAYDGARCGQGRIVTQSSWHHFLDLNLDGIVERNPEAWQLIRQYYLNLADWLCEPRASAATLAELGMAEQLGRYPLIETIDPSDYDAPQSAEAGTRIGEALFDALPQQMTPYRMISVITHCLNRHQPEEKFDGQPVSTGEVIRALGYTALNPSADIAAGLG